jgi:ribosome maturation factor RimP
VSDDRRRRRRSRRDRGDDTDQAQTKPLTDEVRSDIEQWAEEAAQAHGFGVFDLEPTKHGRWIIRVYIERVGEVDEPGQDIKVDECAEVSRYMEAYLDKDDRVPESYVLEVSSPGLERPLKRLDHVERAIGERIEMIVREQVDGRNKFVATLTGLDGETLELEVEPANPDEDSETVDATIDWEDVKKARLKHEFNL